jgi:hypothetical protein
MLAADRGKGQFPGLLKHLSSQRFQGRVDLAAALGEFGRAPVGGLVILISDRLDVWDKPVEDLGRALDYLPAYPGCGLVAPVAPGELAQPAGEFEMLDVETGETANYDVTAQAVETYRQRAGAPGRKQLRWCASRPAPFIP